MIFPSGVFDTFYGLLTRIKFKWTKYVQNMSATPVNMEFISINGRKNFFFYLWMQLFSFYLWIKSMKVTFQTASKMAKFILFMTIESVIIAAKQHIYNFYLISLCLKIATNQIGEKINDALHKIIGMKNGRNAKYVMFG